MSTPTPDQLALQTLQLAEHINAALPPNADHAIVLGALLALYGRIAIDHPCCTASASASCASMALALNDVVATANQAAAAAAKTALANAAGKPLH